MAFNWLPFVKDDDVFKTPLLTIVEPRYFEVPREMEKKFEIAGFRNNRGSVKFITMKHFLIKYSTV